MWNKLLPLIVVLLGGVLLLYPAKPQTVKEDQFNFVSFGKIPIQHGGRFMPLDSLARNALMAISNGSQTYEIKYFDAELKEFVTEKQPAVRWLLEQWCQHPDHRDRQFIRIDSPEIRNALQLEDRPGNYRYSLEELNKPEFWKNITQVQNKLEEGTDLSEEESAWNEFRQQLRLTNELITRKIPAIFPAVNVNEKWISFKDLETTLEENYLESVDGQAAVTAARIKFFEELSKNAQVAEEFRKKFPSVEAANRYIQTASRNKALEDYRAKQLLVDQQESYTDNAKQMLKMLDAFKQDNVQEFNQLLAEYHQNFTPALTSSQLSKIKAEHFLNNWRPFLFCQWTYVLVAVLALFSWLGLTKPLRQSAFWLATLTLAVHFTALVMRIYISGRPPVTNLYSSSVFIGMIALFVSLVLETIYRNGLGSITAGVIGMATMIIAQFLSVTGDTMEMLQAVLDTNFWLWTHVTIVTIGYAACYVAGIIGCAYVFIGMFTKLFANGGDKHAYRMMYGVICFAMLTSFTGTVLGGIWADQSWGRFWGWDPKENGAVLIVIWNAIILHARWAGLVKARGFAILAIQGNIITTWSWFGTNQLGAGLHAYGFSEKLALACTTTWIVFALISILGMVPTRYWASFEPVSIIPERHRRKSKQSD
ncbi:MAG: cytochrome c biogenesis protein CcsA [Zavarzinella sp.]